MVELKKIILIVFFISILSINIAEAKTIVYVTNSSTDTPCSSLGPADDAAFCNRLNATLGYNVKVINEQFVRDNSPTWNSYASTADMIFLGTLTSLMIDTTANQSVFCGNISSKLSTTRTLFAARTSTLYNNSSNLLGCAFDPSINMVSFVFSDNQCWNNTPPPGAIKPLKTFRIIKQGFITDGYALNSNIDLYNSTHIVKIHDLANEGWLGGECSPLGAGSQAEFYPVINTSSKGAFWGLDDASDFTNDAWNFFDKTVFTAINDTGWVIIPQVIPKTSTANQNALVIAKITQRGNTISSGTINFTADGLSGALAYDNGFWKNLVNFTTQKSYTVNVTGYNVTFQGWGTSVLDIGNLSVVINSGNYIPYSNYTISSDIFSGVLPQPANASFRILDSGNYTILYSGNLACNGSNCNTTITNISDMGNPILEINVSNQTAGKVGGNYKTINKSNTLALTLLTDATQYKPLDTIKIDLITSASLDNASFTVIRPDGTLETPAPIPMSFVNSTHWAKNYTLAQVAATGTYTINLTANVGSISNSVNKSVNVTPWNLFADLNRYSFNPTETFNLTIKILNAYSNNLNFSTIVTLTNPNNVATTIYQNFTNGSNIQNVLYTLPSNYLNGLSSLRIFVNDSDGRNASQNLSFIVNFSAYITPSLFINSSSLSEITIVDKIFQRTFSLQNIANVNATNISVNVASSLIGIISVSSSPTFIAPNSNATLVLNIRTQNLSPQVYSGYIYIYSSNGNATISASVEIIGNISQEAEQKLSEVTAFEQQLAELKTKGTNVTELENTLNTVRILLDEATQAFNSEDYSTAKSKIQSASANIDNVRIQISAFSAPPSADNGLLIWISAFIIIIAILAVVIFKFRNKVKSLINRLLRRKKIVEEEQVEEVYYQPESEYRTEYY